MPGLDKKALTERDICTKFITPALVGSDSPKWNVMTQLREEYYFTKGRVIVRGKTVKRGEAKKADYLLFYIQIAVIEAKDNNHSVGAGMQQALEYAEILDVPFAYSSNGDAFLEHDRTGGEGAVEREIPLHEFPPPEELWARFCKARTYSQKQVSVATQNYFDDGSGKSPRYYQMIAVNRTVEAIAQGENRILLVMATGTGKTYTAFQIIWRLWKSGAIYEPKSGEGPVPPDEPPDRGPDGAMDGYPIPSPGDSEPAGVCERPATYYVDDVEVTVATERVQYLDGNGRLITESLKDYSHKTLRKAYASLDEFLTVWKTAERKQAIVEELASRGLFLEEFGEQVGRDYDAFDLICHVAFDQPPLTRRERAANVRKRNSFGKYGDKARAVLSALLEKYADAGLKSVESLEILKVAPLSTFGTPIEIVTLFGGKEKYLAAVR